MRPAHSKPKPCRGQGPGGLQRGGHRDGALPHGLLQHLAAGVPQREALQPQGANDINMKGAKRHQSQGANHGRMTHGRGSRKRGGRSRCPSDWGGSAGPQFDVSAGPHLNARAAASLNDSQEETRKRTKPRHTGSLLGRQAHGNACRSRTLNAERCNASVSDDSMQQMLSGPSSHLHIVPSSGAFVPPSHCAIIKRAA